MNCAWWDHTIGCMKTFTDREWYVNGGEEQNWES